MNMPPEFETMIREKAREGYTPSLIKADVDAVFAKMTAEAAARTFGGAAGRAERFAATGDTSVLTEGLSGPQEFIVTLSKHYGQNSRVNYVEATSEADARSCFQDRPADVQIVRVEATGRRY